MKCHATEKVIQIDSNFASDATATATFIVVVVAVAVVVVVGGGVVAIVAVANHGDHRFNLPYNTKTNDCNGQPLIASAIRPTKERRSRRATTTKPATMTTTTDYM